jgi:hypothetical protein
MSRNRSRPGRTGIKTKISDPETAKNNSTRARKSAGRQIPVFRIRIHVFFGLPDPDPLVKGIDPDPALDPSIIMQKY